MQDSIEYEVYCRKLPPLSLHVAGIEFKCRVRPKKNLRLACLQRFKGAGMEELRCWTKAVVDMAYVESGDSRLCNYWAVEKSAGRQ